MSVNWDTAAFDPERSPAFFYLGSRFADVPRSDTRARALNRSAQCRSGNIFIAQA
jgi:hypothetical protein